MSFFGTLMRAPDFLRSWWREPVDYETAKTLARDPNPAVRRRLAERDDVQPELLYYLAEDEVPDVRRAIAANLATPGQANVFLARDRDDGVRIELAEKIGRLLPSLTASEQTHLRDLAIQAIEILADDQLPKVRAMLADTLKNIADVPRPLVLKLARDAEAIVSVPVLEYSPLLSDEDLLSIIESGAFGEPLAAIARRDRVSEPLSDAIAVTLDEKAVGALLANPSAQIREETLDMLVEYAPDRICWHRPLVERPMLSVMAIGKIAKFVASALIDVLSTRNGLDPKTRSQLSREMTRRLETEAASAKIIEGNTGSAGAAPAEAGGEEAAGDLHALGNLDEAAIMDAIERRDRGFTLRALALLAALPEARISQILASKQPRSISALTWKAGLGMRTSVKLQQRMAQVPPSQILNARNGFDYPMTDADLERQWELACI
jgi:uncharacterized protein (DUF2336 family)